jgi:hypothetical protein
VEARRVVLLFEHNFAKEHERPGDGEATGCLPFLPEEGLSRQLGGRAVHEAMLSRFWESLLAACVGGEDAYLLEPGAHRQLIVEGEPGEGSNFTRTCIVPHPRNDLGDSGVAQV